MKYVLFILAILAFFAGLGILFSANSAIHEIEAFVLCIASAVLLSGGAIVGAVGRIEKRIETASRESE